MHGAWARIETQKLQDAKSQDMVVPSLRPRYALWSYLCYLEPAGKWPGFFDTSFFEEVLRW